MNPPGRKTSNEAKDHVRVQGTHEPLVDLETFERCQQRLVEQRRNTTPKRGGGDLTLTGLLWCGHCNRRMVGCHQRGVPHYLCGSYLQYGKAHCSLNRLPQNELQVAIFKKVKDHFTPEFFDACRIVLLSETQNDGISQDVSRLPRRLADLEGQLARAARRILTEEDDVLATAYRKEAKAMQAERDCLAVDLEKAKLTTRSQGDPSTGPPWREKGWKRC